MTFPDSCSHLPARWTSKSVLFFFLWSGTLNISWEHGHSKWKLHVPDILRLTVALWLNIGLWGISRKNVFWRREHSFPLLFTVGWNVDATVRAGAAILAHELEGGIPIHKAYKFLTTWWNTAAMPASFGLLPPKFMYMGEICTFKAIVFYFHEYSECNLNIPNTLVLVYEIEGQVCWMISRQDAFSPCKRRVLFPHLGCLPDFYLWAW